MQGTVPKIKIVAMKVQNKNVTQVGGIGNTLELFKIDLDELT